MGNGVSSLGEWIQAKCEEEGLSLRLLLGHATLSMVLRYSRYVDVQRALAEHHLFNPLDRLMRGQSNGRRGWHY